MIKKKEDHIMADSADVLLIQRVQEGNEDAFNELYDKYHRLVYFIAFEICRNDADAKDILQDTFMQVKHSIHTLQDQASFKAWLNRIVVNKCKNMFRSRRSVEMEQESLWYQYHVNEERNYMLPEASLHAKSDQQVIHEMLAALSVQQREVLIMRYFQHMSMKEIAGILEVPEGTVKTRLMYGKNHLKKMILAYEQESGAKLDFRVEGGSLSLLFLYLYEQGLVCPPLPIYKKAINYKPNFRNSTIAFLSMATITFIAMGYVAYQDASAVRDARDSESAILLMEKSKAREYYYILMDWACCRDDMMVKNKQDFEAIMPVYQRMKQSSSLYLKRLTQDHWIADFEEMYHSFE